MTADELSFAGSRFGNIVSTWFSNNNESRSITENANWWTMSPYMFNNGVAIVVDVRNESSTGRGLVSAANVSNIRNYCVRPVVSLKSCVQVSSGNGAWNTPYEVEIDSTCALTEN